MTFLRTRFEWLDVLSAKSSIAAELALKTKLADEIYKTQNKKALNKDAFNLSNNNDHNDILASTIDGLAAKGADLKNLSKLLVDLTSRNTYGTFCEISAYGYLLKGKHDFDIQLPMDGSAILNPHGADLDGLLRLPQEVAFDVKAFGFHEHLVSRLTERLSYDLAPDIVVAQDSWDVPISTLFDLLSTQYEQLVQELRQSRSAARDAIRFVVRTPARVQVSSRELDPGKLARKNADYAFSYAKQFARHKPFILVFVIHPWASGALHVNFYGYVDDFTQALAQITFCQFMADTSPIFDVTKSHASQLLSGILFMNAWAGTPPAEPPLYRLFLNPNAINPLHPASVETLAAPYGDDMTVTKIQCPSAQSDPLRGDM
ncbi:hypothetical protein VRZ08_21075 [Rhodopseudomonas sp. G2_2311]|uniref:hypothetical protein n=1 Tax=Rhodopseudomonas sp. G2_2311 TaxID=3114287 RepID=UPI0039C5AEA4